MDMREDVDAGGDIAMYFNNCKMMILLQVGVWSMEARRNLGSLEDV